MLGRWPSLQDLMAKLEQKDKDITASGLESQARLNGERADIVEQIIGLSTGDDRELWLRQLADTVSAATQSGEYPGGVQRLTELKEKLGKNKASEDLQAYVEFRALTAEYGDKIQKPKPDFAKIQKWWLESLEGFVKDHPREPRYGRSHAAVGHRPGVCRRGDQGQGMVRQDRRGISQVDLGQKGHGRQHPLGLRGKGDSARRPNPRRARPVNLTQFRGKVVVVQYWATTCGPCKVDMAELKELVAKYGRDGWRSSA